MSCAKARCSAEKVRLGQLDQFAPVAAEDSLECEHAESIRLLERDLGWHRQLLRVDQHVEQGRTAMSKRSRHRALQIRRILYANPENAHGLRHLREVGIFQVGPGR